MSGKYALIIGNTEYIDPGLAQLTAPSKDAEDLARVLKDSNICAFDDVKILANELSSTVIERIDEFFDQKKPDDMLVLYFSGHGVRDEGGSLYLAFKNTIRSRLRSTAVKSDYIKEAMDQSRSKRQVLILDCCNSGAFAQGTKAEIGGIMGLTQAFQGYGRFVLTASDATQFAWEGDKVIGETQNSLFTHFLLEGLEGEADSDGDGNITVDELYDYAYEQVSKVTPNQTPTKSASKVAGDIILRQITRIEDIKPVALPNELLEAAEDPRTFVRESAVQLLAKYLNGKNLGLARSAREVLERIAENDDSRQVSRAAILALEPIRQAEQSTKQKINPEANAEHVGIQKTAQQILHERTIEAERQEKDKAAQYATKLAEEHPAKEAIEVKPFIQKGQIAAEQSIQEVKISKQYKVLNALKSFLSITIKLNQPRSMIVLFLGIMVLVFGLWIFLPQLVFFSSNSSSESQAVFVNSPSLSIQNIDYESTSFPLNGIHIELVAQTTSELIDKPCQVIVYVQHPSGTNLTATRSFKNILSPYISEDGIVSVYKDLTPTHANSTWNITLFIPFTAFESSGLQKGDTPLLLQAELHSMDSHKLIAHSSTEAFIYTK